MTFDRRAFGFPPLAAIAVAKLGVRRALRLGAVVAGLGLGAAAAPSVAEGYIDDRSTPERVIASLYNALNAGEYARAWSYYAGDAHPTRSYRDFVAGYADTNLVALRTGAPSEDAGMSKVYTAIPVALRARQRDGSTAYFSGCYLTLTIAPGVQDPPFRGTEIIGARLRKAGGPTGEQPPTDCDPAQIPRFSR